MKNEAINEKVVDPFDCFGDEDDSEIDDTNPQQEESERDPSCGILAFHPGTEKALLNHVESTLANHSLSSRAIDISSLVLSSIDDFSMKRHWMMHVGSKKTAIIQQFVEECCCNSIKSNREQQSLVFVELGSYCGYSSIMLAKTILALGYKFHIFSVEVVAEYAQIAKKMISCAGFDEHISILHHDNDENESLEVLLKNNLPSGDEASTDPPIHFLFIDHDKSLYLQDLRLLENSGLIKKGCYVAADNVIFAGIEDYRKYITVLTSKGYIQSRLADAWLEYCEPDFNANLSKKNLMQDGIELSTYLKDPPLHL